MTELEALRLLDEIRTPAAFFAQGRRPYVICGRSRYEVTSRGTVITFTAVGKSGMRWSLDPGESLAADHWLKKVREIGAEVLEVKRGSQKGVA